MIACTYLPQKTINVTFAQLNNGSCVKIIEFSVDRELNQEYVYISVTF